jgi:hypothetical protein
MYAIRGPIPFMFKQWGAWKPVDWYTQATHAVRYSDGRLFKLEHEPYSAGRGAGCSPEWVGIINVGKHAAGRELDGKIYDGNSCHIGISTDKD